MNDYPIIDIEALASDIRTSGYLEPLGVILNPAYPLFKNGIPCMVKRNVSETDEEIMLILANKQRNMAEDFKRQKAQRLIRLYEIKQAQTGKKINVTKKVSEDLGIGVRQVQRYSKIEHSLIPELQQALDDSSINLESAASIAGMDEAMQRTILQLLEAGHKISSQEISQMKTIPAGELEKIKAFATLENLYKDL